MIGNDVIDLNLARQESNILRIPILKKIFTPSEQALILEAAEPVLMAWLFWSMKEAAYKIINRSTGRRFYAPKAFVCCLSEANRPLQTSLAGASQELSPRLSGANQNAFAQVNFYKGFVSFENQFFNTETTSRSNFIHTLALTDCRFETIEVIASDKYAYTNRQKLVERLLKTTDFVFLKNHTGIPFLKHKSSAIPLPVTLSHHGQYLILAWQQLQTSITGYP